MSNEAPEKQPSARSSQDVPVVSVIIPAYNAAATLPMQLQALETQIDPPRFEVIVVDNGSTDDLQSVLAPHLEGPLQLRVIRADDHQGASYARNVGIGAARAEVLMFCDADDAVSETWILRGVRASQQTQLWAGAALLHDRFSEDMTLSEVRGLLAELHPADDSIQEMTGPFPVVPGGDFGISRTAMEQVGGFDQSFPLAGDDNDLAFRAQAAGVRMHHVPGMQVACRDHGRRRDRMRIGRRAAIAHCLLATRYSAWPDSQMPPWAVELLRCCGAAVKMAARPRRADWSNLVLRTWIAIGLAQGTVRYRYLRRIPDPQIGVGWARGEGA